MGFGRRDRSKIRSGDNLVDLWISCLQKRGVGAGWGYAVDISKKKSWICFQVKFKMVLLKQGN